MFTALIVSSVAVVMLPTKHPQATSSFVDQKCDKNTEYEHPSNIFFSEEL